MMEMMGMMGMMDYDVVLITVHHYHRLDHSLKYNHVQVRRKAKMDLPNTLIPAIVGKAVLPYNLCVGQVA